MDKTFAGFHERAVEHDQEDDGLQHRPKALFYCRQCGWRFFTRRQAIQAQRYGCPGCDRVDIGKVS
ncbi:MAG: hypothetical protein QMC96_12225 [Methanomicrobiales archaeon]|nr:hypothetical protein [Methanomicrobiales archaeon]